MRCLTIQGVGHMADDATLEQGAPTSRAAATQPGACFGLVLITDLSSVRARLMSPISASVLILM